MAYYLGLDNTLLRKDFGTVYGVSKERIQFKGIKQQHGIIRSGRRIHVGKTLV